MTVRRDAYRFVDKSEIIDLVRTAWQRSGRSIASVAKEAEVCQNTLYGWLYGATKRPQWAKVQAVLAALGVRVELRYTDSGSELVRDGRAIGAMWRHWQARRIARARRKGGAQVVELRKRGRGQERGQKNG